MNLRIFEEEVDDTQSPRLTDRQGRSGIAKKASTEVGLRQPESAASKEEKEEKEGRAEKAGSAPAGASSATMTAEEAIAALQAFIPPPGPINHVK